jgi:hypothetical protein
MINIETTARILGVNLYAKPSKSRNLCKVVEVITIILRR